MTVPASARSCAGTDLRYRDDLVERLEGHLSRDERVRALWLGGSLGREGGDALSDIDLYVAVSDGEWAGFLVDLPTRFDLVEPLAYFHELPFFRGHPCERVWFLYFRDLPVYWKLDCHVQTVSAASGLAKLDVNQWRELAYGGRRILYDPDGILGRRHAIPQIPQPEPAVLRSHLARILPDLPSQFVMALPAIARSDFWLATYRLQDIYHRVLYLTALDADPTVMGDTHPRHWARACRPDAVSWVADTVFDRDRCSMATAAMRLLSVYAEVADRLCARFDLPFPREFIQRIAEAYRLHACPGEPG